MYRQTDLNQFTTTKHTIQYNTWKFYQSPKKHEAVLYKGSLEGHSLPFDRKCGVSSNSMKCVLKDDKIYMN